MGVVNFKGADPRTLNSDGHLNVCCVNQVDHQVVDLLSIVQHILQFRPLVGSTQAVVLLRCEGKEGCLL